MRSGRQRRGCLQSRQRGLSHFRRRGQTHHKSCEKSDQRQGGEAETDPKPDRKNERPPRLGKKLVRRSAGRFPRRRIARSTIRRRQSLPPSRVWLLPGEQDKALIVFLRRKAPSRPARKQRSVH